MDPINMWSGFCGPTFDLAIEKDVGRIIELQKQNLAHSLTPEERERYGCVGIITPEYLLREIVADEQIPVVRFEGEVIAYFIPADIAHAWQLTELHTLLKKLDRLAFNHIALSDFRIALGVQAVVAKDWRGQGVAELLYRGTRKLLSKRFELCLSEISSSNTRSMRAHRKNGWVVVETFEADDRGVEGKEWNTVLLDLRELQVET